MTHMVKLLAGAAALLMASPAMAEDNWGLSIDGGVSASEGLEDQLFGSLAIAREFESGYVELSVAAVDAGSIPGLFNSVPANSLRGTVSVGKTLGDFSLDGYVSLGKRKFETERFARLGRNVTIASDGSSFGIGAAVQYQIALSESVFLAPMLAIDYDTIDTARVVNLGGGTLQTIEDKEKGTTGTAGLGLDLLFGAEQEHQFSLSSAFVASSNSAAARASAPGGIAERIAAGRDFPGISDEWAEIGALASFRLSEPLRLKLSVSRTIGFIGPESTTFGAGLSFDF